jgi:hypothetical protein
MVHKFIGIDKENASCGFCQFVPFSKANSEISQERTAIGVKPISINDVSKFVISANKIDFNGLQGRKIGISQARVPSGMSKKSKFGQLSPDLLPSSPFDTYL